MIKDYALVILGKEDLPTKTLQTLNDFLTRVCNTFELTDIEVKVSLEQVRDQTSATLTSRLHGDSAAAFTDALQLFTDATSAAHCSSIQKASMDLADQVADPADFIKQREETAFPSPFFRDPRGQRAKTTSKNAKNG